MISRRGRSTAAGGSAAVLGVAGLGRAWQQGLILFNDDAGLGGLGPTGTSIAFRGRWRWCRPACWPPARTTPSRGALPSAAMASMSSKCRSAIWAPWTPSAASGWRGWAVPSTTWRWRQPVIGRAAVVRLLPDPADPRHVARLELGPESNAPPPEHPLVRAIGRRHTDRRAWRGGGIARAGFARHRWPTAGSPLVRIDLITPASQAGQRFAALTLDATARHCCRRRHDGGKPALDAKRAAGMGRQRRTGCRPPHRASRPGRQRRRPCCRRCRPKPKGASGWRRRATRRCPPPRCSR